MNSEQRKKHRNYQHSRKRWKCWKCDKWKEVSYLSKNEMTEEEIEALEQKGIEARRAYQRKWAREHPDNVRATKARYWAKKAEQMKAEQAAAVQAGRQTPQD